MTDLPIMPVYVERLLADTDHLSNEEFGAYTRLLLAGWLRQGALEIDDLPRLAHESRQRWPSLWRRLAVFFTSDGNGKVGQKRLTSTLENAKKIHAANRARTVKARAVKAKKNKAAPQNDRASTEDVTASVTASVTEPVATSKPNKSRTLPYQVESSTLAKPAKGETSAQVGAPGHLAGRAPSAPSRSDPDPPSPFVHERDLMSPAERAEADARRAALVASLGAGGGVGSKFDPSKPVVEPDHAEPDDRPEPGGDSASDGELPKPAGAVDGEPGAAAVDANAQGAGGDAAGPGPGERQAEAEDESPLMRALNSRRKP